MREQPSHNDAVGLNLLKATYNKQVKDRRNSKIDSLSDVRENSYLGDVLRQIQSERIVLRSV